MVGKLAGYGRVEGLAALAALNALLARGNQPECQRGHSNTAQPVPMRAGLWHSRRMFLSRCSSLIANLAGTECDPCLSQVCRRNHQHNPGHEHGHAQTWNDGEPAEQQRHHLRIVRLGCSNQVRG